MIGTSSSFARALSDREISEIEAKALYERRIERYSLTKPGKNLSPKRRAELFEHFFATDYLPAMRLRAELQDARAEWNDERISAYRTV